MQLLLELGFYIDNEEAVRLLQEAGVRVEEKRAYPARELIDAARTGIPSEFVSMPLPGANAPITLLGAIVQHTAENLAGVVITQLAGAGAPIIWGGSPAAFDMRRGCTPMGSIDTMLIDLGYAEVGKSLNLPTHAYLGMSDAKVLDAQSGFESGMGCLLAGIKGINMVSGAGMMNFESTQSIQKLIIDNEICGMTYKFLKGLSRRDEPIALELLRTLIDSNHLLTHPHTLKWMTAEHFYPGKVVDRSTIDEWELKGRKTAGQRAWEEAKALIAVHPGITLDGDRADELEALVSRDLRRFGCDTLPTQV